MTPNPFNPPAANPRYLAGRKTEQAALADVLDAGGQARSPSSMRRLARWASTTRPFPA